MFNLLTLQVHFALSMLKCLRLSWLIWKQTTTSNLMRWFKSKAFMPISTRAFAVLSVNFDSLRNEYCLKLNVNIKDSVLWMTLSYYWYTFSETYLETPHFITRRSPRIRPWSSSCCRPWNSAHCRQTLRTWSATLLESSFTKAPIFLRWPQCLTSREKITEKMYVFIYFVTDCKWLKRVVCSLSYTLPYRSPYLFGSKYLCLTNVSRLVVSG